MVAVLLDDSLNTRGQSYPGCNHSRREAQACSKACSAYGNDLWMQLMGLFLHIYTHMHTHVHKTDVGAHASFIRWYEGSMKDGAVFPPVIGACSSGFDLGERPL